MAAREYAKIFPRVKSTSPFYQLLGIEEVKVSDGYASLQMAFRPELTHTYGIVHGGALTALIDSTVAVALLTRIGRGQTITTIELKVNFAVSRLSNSLALSETQMRFFGFASECQARVLARRCGCIRKRSLCHSEGVQRPKNLAPRQRS